MTQSKVRRRAIMAAAAALAVAMPGGAAQGQGGPATPTELVRQFQAAMAARDVERIASLYAEQGAILTPQGGAIAGRERIRASLTRNLAAGQPGLRMLNARFDGDAEGGVVVWVWEVEGADQAPPAQRRRIRSMLYVKKAAGGWEIVLDMFQVFSPPPG